MSRSNKNILQFPNSPLHGWNLKVFAVLFYVFVAFMLTKVVGPTEGAMGFLIVLGFMYHFLLRNQMMSQRYLKQNTILLVILFLLAVFVFPLTLIPIIVVGIVYGLLIGRFTREAPYFVRYHLLTAIVLNALVILAFLLLFAVTDFANQLLLLFHIKTTFIVDIHTYGFFLILGILWVIAAWLSVAALSGRTPYIGLVTNNIRHWT
jgi:hypothetical protein